MNAMGRVMKNAHGAMAQVMKNAFHAEVEDLKNVTVATALERKDVHHAPEMDMISMEANVLCVGVEDIKSASHVTELAERNVSLVVAKGIKIVHGAGVEVMMIAIIVMAKDSSIATAAMVMVF